MYVTGKKIPAELLIPLFPEATIILEVSQNPVFPGTMQIHFRAGRKFPKGGSFVNLDLRRFHMGGRWDAGGSSRQIEEERLVDPSEIALYMATHIEDLVQNRENE